MKNVFRYVKLTDPLLFDFRKIDSHTGGKWLIQETKYRTDNESRRLWLSCRIS